MYSVVALLILIIVTPLIVVGMLALPVLVPLALAPFAIIWEVVEKIRTSLVDASIERRVEAGMTPEEAREAVEREQYERAHQETSLGHIALVSAAFMLVIALVGVVDYFVSTQTDKSTSSSTSTVVREGPHRFETREGGLYDRERGYALPHVGMSVSDVDDTYYMGKHTSSEDDTYYDFVLVWEAKNGTHDPVLKAYIKNGRVYHVEYCKESVYWTDESGLPDLYAEPWWLPREDESTGETEQGVNSDAGDTEAATDVAKAPADTYEGNPSAAFDPLDYDSAEEYADDAEGWFRDHGSADPYGDALEYWEDNGP